MRRHIYIIIGVAALLFASCGQQGDAERLAKRFVEEHAVAPEKFTKKDFADLDSTRNIPDSLILHLRTLKDPLFKGDIPYAATVPEKLLYLRMRFRYDTLQLSRTFYFDETLTEVVAFK